MGNKSISSPYSYSNPKRGFEASSNLTVEYSSGSKRNLLKNGDVIKELNGKQYEAKDIEQVREILAYAQKLKLVIHRGDQTLYRIIE